MDKNLIVTAIYYAIYICYHLIMVFIEWLQIKIRKGKKEKIIYVKRVERIEKMNSIRPSARPKKIHNNESN